MEDERKALMSRTYQVLSRVADELTRMGAAARKDGRSATLSVVVGDRLCRVGVRRGVWSRVRRKTTLASGDTVVYEYPGLLVNQHVHGRRVAADAWLVWYEPMEAEGEGDGSVRYVVRGPNGGKTTHLHGFATGKFEMRYRPTTEIREAARRVLGLLAGNQREE